MGGASDYHRIISKGRTLIVGRNEDQVKDCGWILARWLSCLMMVEDPPGWPGAENDRVDYLLHGSDVQISGYLGRFRASARINEEEMHLGRLVEGAPAWFDLVLDLRPVAAGSFELPPPGYYAPYGDLDELERALGELPLMVGVFECNPNVSAFAAA